MSYISIIGSLMVVGLFIFIIAWPNYKRMKLQEATKGKMYAIITKPGARVTGLFPADDLTIDIPVETLKGGEHVKDKDKGILSYVLKPDAIEPMLYPPHSAESSRSWITKWINPTVSIRSIMLTEGYGIPLVPYNLDTETGKMIIPPGTEASLIYAYKDQAHAKALREGGRRHAEGDIRASGGIKKSTLNILLIGVAIAAIGALIAVVLGYLNYTGITDIGQYY